MRGGAEGRGVTVRGWWRGMRAVAGATWKGMLWRTGWVAAAGVALAGLCAGLPWALGAGGEERLRLYLTYATGAAGFGLSVFALWAGCAGVSGDAERGTLAGLLAGAAGRGAVWCGKWAAATGASWALLAAVSGTVALTGWRVAAAGGGGCDGAGVAYETRRGALPDVSGEVAKRMAAWRARGRPGGAAGEAAAEEAFRRAALAERYRLGGGNGAEWRFDASGRTPGEPLVLSWLCHAGVPGAMALRAEADIGDGRSVVLEGPAGGRREVRLAWDGGAELTVRARLAEDEGVDYWFDPEEGMLLRVPRGGLAGNAAKAVTSWAGRLALLAAVGVTLGTLFSMPVASFLAVALLALLQCADLLEEASGVDREAFVRSLTAVMSGGGGHGHGGEEAEPREAGPWAERGAAAVYYLYRGTGWALRPFTADHSARQLCDGEWIPPGEVARGLGWRLAVLPAALGAAGAWVLRRREWGNWGGTRS